MQGKEGLRCKPIWRRWIRGWKNLMQRDMYSEEQSESERLREERRTKKRNDPISSESEQGEFEIGVNLVQEEGNGSPNEEGDETESEEEGEEVNQLVDEDDKRGTKMSQWKRLRKSKRRMSSPCTKSTMMLSSPWALWRPSTHMMTP
ncbi:unnamed protein product [Microthlaspi erraticum]|uniref:Uncharacterized protein n=1 Tax=Microthlaspi erraticum TaxID=1685480 RepID=A0A6D2LEP6_9BRAS|nr:unnamed protein product [Microthlaspi erraticum]